MNGAEIAIIGISCRFPGADNWQEFWDNLVQGKESLAFLSDGEIDGIADKRFTGDNRYVPCRGGVLNDTDRFDAPFFGYSPKEAELMDPQIRIFHECVWNALEDAGYPPRASGAVTGLYGSAADNLHWRNNILFSPGGRLRDSFATAQLIDKDFICSRVAYNLNLTGPCYSLHTACSTSLVAVHLACQAILSGECELAAAGGICINYGMDKGYLHQEGSILSPDGHCRAFDAGANGTIPGSGVGVVVLKLLENAIKDKDAIYAIIKGSAINNDGKQKVGYTSPGVPGQTRVIRSALSMAEIDPSTIHYVEAHGTGTPLGDPVEIEALKQAFGKNGKQYCGIGSVKTNLGHLDVAAGIAGLIKTVLFLKHRKIPPTLNYHSPNPKIDFDHSPFYVVDRLKDLGDCPMPLRAGVSSFGIGGTNAHVILEEYTETRVEDPSPDRHHLFLLSARTQTSLQKAGKRLCQYLEAGPGDSLADIAYTLSAGREPFAKRKAIAARDQADLLSKLQVIDWQKAASPEPNELTGEIIFMFPGQGSQYINMAREIYEQESLFRAYIDQGLSAYRKLTGRDIRSLLFQEPPFAAEDELHHTKYTQPVLFLLQYAMARTLMDLGIKPGHMIGHSIGEYVAACLAGVFSFEDGLAIIAKRGELMQSMPPGAMLSIAISREELDKVLDGSVSIAAINCPGNIVISGDGNRIREIGEELKAQGYASALVKTSHAFHSEMMEPVLADFKTYLRTFHFRQPDCKFISNVSGEEIRDSEAVDPDYWAGQLRHTVNFSAGMDLLLEQYPRGTFIELGPGQMLSSFARKSKAFQSHKMVNMIKPDRNKTDDHAFFLHSLGLLWEYGITIDWNILYRDMPKKRVHLPTYVFDDHRFNASPAWRSVDELLKDKGKAGAGNEPGSIYHLPYWEQTLPPEYAAGEGPDGRRNGPAAGPFNWLIFINETLTMDETSRYLDGHSTHTVFVKEGDGFKEFSPHFFSIRPSEKEDYFRLMELLKARDILPDRIIHAWSLVREQEQEISFHRVEKYKKLGFYSLVYLVQSIGALGLTRTMDISVISNGSMNVLGNDCQYPEKALIIGLSKIIPIEYPHVKCRYIDMLPEAGESNMRLFKKTLYDQLLHPGSHLQVALRGNHAWVQHYKRVEMQAKKNPPLQRGGTYLITGGLGGMALYLARFLASGYQATIILVTRTKPESLDRSIEQNRIKLQLIEETEQAGGKIIYWQADIGDEEKMRLLVESYERQSGKIDGILHTAATIDEFGAIQKRKAADFEASLHAKVQGTMVLYTLFKNRPLDFIVLFSSGGTISYGSKYGEAGYVAANEFLDAMAGYPFGNGHTVVRTINWCDWSQVGISVRSIDKFYAADQAAKNSALAEFEKDALSPDEGVAAFVEIMSRRMPRVALSRSSLKDLDQANQDGWKRKQDLFLKQNKARQKPLPERPGEGGYTAPANDLQKRIVGIWQDYFGYKGIGIHENIFELGANSLDVAQINEAFKKLLNLDIPLVTLFEYPTIDKLAQYINGNPSIAANGSSERRIDEGKSKINKIRGLSNR